MSVAEIKRAVVDLSDEERLDVAHFLLQLSRQNDPEWRAEIGRRLDRAEQGAAHSQEELIALHHRLSSEGK